MLSIKIKLDTTLAVRKSTIKMGIKLQEYLVVVGAEINAFYVSFERRMFKRRKGILTTTRLVFAEQTVEQTK